MANWKTLWKKRLLNVHNRVGIRTKSRNLLAEIFVTKSTLQDKFGKNNFLGYITYWLSFTNTVVSYLLKNNLKDNMKF